MPQLSDLQNAVLTLLHEAQNSPVAELDPGGSGTSPVITTASQITTFLNEGCADLARNAVPVPGTATLSADAGFYAYSGMSSADDGTLWYARSASWSGIALKPISRTALSIWFPTWQTDSTATPLYWFRDGVEGIGIYPMPATAGTLAVAGFEIPQPLANPTDTLSEWLPDHLTKLPVWYAAAQVALQNDEDTSLKVRAVTWSQAYQEAVQELQKQLWQSDPSLAKALWGIPPAPPQMSQQGQA